jgi:hypothetical protein
VRAAVDDDEPVRRRRPRPDGLGRATAAPARRGGIYTQVGNGDFVADTKIAWRDAYDMQMRAAVRPLAQAAE